MMTKSGRDSLFGLPIVGGVLAFLVGLAVPAFATLAAGTLAGDSDLFFYYVFPPVLMVWNVMLQRWLKLVLSTPIMPMPLAVLGLIRSLYVLVQYVRT